MSDERRVLSIEDHRRTMAGLKYVYPVLSRRAKGISLGINLNPDKVCNFDCAYCQVDREVPGFKGLDLDLLEKELSTLLAWVAHGSLFQYPPYDTVTGSSRRVNDLCFAGDGEPTAVPEFLDCATLAIDLKERYGLDDLKIVLITNATMFHKPRVLGGIDLMARANGEVWAKLDAGSEGYFRRVSSAVIPFRRILDNLERVALRTPLVIQSLFLELEGQGPTDAELEAYIGRLKAILASGGQIKLVQVYTVARPPPRPDVFALPNHEIDRIVELLTGALALPVEGYYGSPKFVRAKENAPKVGIRLEPGPTTRA